VHIYGIAATETKDRTGESIDLNGMDIADIRLLNDEHSSDRFFEILGYIDIAKKIFSKEECEDEYQLRCWNMIKKPFLFISGKLMDGHPNAQSAASLIKYSMQNPNYPVGLSVEGSTLERQGPKLLKTKVKNVSLTIKPANPECKIFAKTDLTKNFEKIDLPDRYKNVHEGRKQFRELPSKRMRLLAKSELLKDLVNLAKSEDELQISGATIMKCWNCGEGKTFLKSRLPNRCSACNERFTMSDIYKALSCKE
jgi:hypothetical protein